MSYPVSVKYVFNIIHRFTPSRLFSSFPNKVFLAGVHRVLVGKPEGKRPLGRHRHRWEDNIKMDVQEVGGGGGDWMELTQDRDRWQALVSTGMNLWVP